MRKQLIKFELELNLNLCIYLIDFINNNNLHYQSIIIFTIKYSINY